MLLIISTFILLYKRKISNMGERGHEANQILGVGRPERAIHFIKYKKRERVQRGANVHFLFHYYLLLAVS
jgi:hypothetical protein